MRQRKTKDDKNEGECKESMAVGWGYALQQLAEHRQSSTLMGNGFDLKMTSFTGSDMSEMQCRKSENAIHQKWKQNCNLRDRFAPYLLRRSFIRKGVTCSGCVMMKKFEVAHPRNYRGPGKVDRVRK